MRDPGSIDAPADFLHDVAGVEIGARKVDGLWNDGIPGTLHEPHFFQNLLDNAQIELVDEPCILEGRDKVGRGHKSPYRVDPAGKRLLIADPAADGTDDGLVVHRDPFFLDRLVEIGDDILLLVLQIAHTDVVVAEA